MYVEAESQPQMSFLVIQLPLPPSENSSSVGHHNRLNVLSQEAVYLFAFFFVLVFVLLRQGLSLNLGLTQEAQLAAI